jgi:Zn-dependent peptidase ImmA (M78 family)/transcriptional regulator with XRE-family HTH domain
MSVTQIELGARLRQAREAAGLTQEAVADQMELSRSAVAQLEAGNRVVSSMELDRMARLYGRDMRDFFAAEFGPENALAGLFRRNEDIADDPQAMEALRRCISLGRELTNLERLIGLARDPSSAVRYRVAAPRSRYDAIRQGTSIADQERRRLGIGECALPDVTELLELQGVRTALVTLPKDVSGLTLVDPEAGPFVAVNREEHLFRRNFSFAHEYAHVLMDCDAHGIISRGSDRAELQEVRANSFAASLLLPEGGVREVLGTLGKSAQTQLLVETPLDDERAEGIEARGATPAKIQMHDVVLLARSFGVSRQVVLYRLRNLRILSERELNELLKLEEAGHGRQLEKLLELPEPDHARERNRFQHRFLSLALEAYRCESISKSKLEELFSQILDRPRAQLALDQFGVVTDDPPTSVSLPS